jgi:hypothetical protein
VFTNNDDRDAREISFSFLVCTHGTCLPGVKDLFPGLHAFLGIKVVCTCLLGDERSLSWFVLPFYLWRVLYEPLETFGGAIGPLDVNVTELAVDLTWGVALQ